MRRDELRALVHKYFQNALATQPDRLGAGGPLSEQELAPFQTTLTLTEASQTEFFDIIHPGGTDAIWPRLFWLPVVCLMSHSSVKTMG
jgi:hypothetical protein